VALCVLSQAAAAARERRAEAEARAAAEDAERARAEESALTDEQRKARARAPAGWGPRLLTCVFVLLCLFVLVLQARQVAEVDRLRSRKLAEFQARRIARHAELERNNAGNLGSSSLGYVCE
jgi:hypothetical protein